MDAYLRMTKVDWAVTALRLVVRELTEAPAPRAAAAARRALKSAEGAQRHADRVWAKAQREAA